MICFLVLQTLTILSLAVDEDHYKRSSTNSLDENFDNEHGMRNSIPDVVFDVKHANKSFMYMYLIE